MNNINEDNQGYWNFTGPYRVQKSMNTLEGMLKGFAFDGTITSNEFNILIEWVQEHSELRKKNPFKEIIELIEESVSDGVLDNEEIKDIIWLCEKYNQNTVEFNEITADMMQLQGLFSGIIADGVITKSELEQLSDWIDAHDHLKGNWPYDEVDSLIISVLKDGIIDNKEHNLLLKFFAEFLRVGDHKVISYPLNEVEVPIQGICATCPDVIIPGKSFCITGKFENHSRNEIAKIIKYKNGIFSKGLNKNVDYLLIGADGNKAWAFSCYGRKVEQAINYRKSGHNILMIHEYDFWDAIAE
ncbi:MAG: BRCT domain-containing protein [Phycisphaerae bacterium]|nr:BRCT domain-containing protein [Phycisphaerae bacterium]